MRRRRLGRAGATAQALAVMTMMAATARAADDGAPAAGTGEAAQAAPADPEADACIDENVKADLFAKRKRRDVRDRLFQQTNRHELTALGGYYVSDLSSVMWYA